MFGATAKCSSFHPPPPSIEHAVPLLKPLFAVISYAMRRLHGPPCEELKTHFDYPRCGYRSCQQQLSPAERRHCVEPRRRHPSARRIHFGWRVLLFPTEDTRRWRARRSCDSAGGGGDITAKIGQFLSHPAPRPLHPGRPPKPSLAAGLSKRRRREGCRLAPRRPLGGRDKRSRRAEGEPTAAPPRRRAARHSDGISAAVPEAGRAGAAPRAPPGRPKLFPGPAFRLHLPAPDRQSPTRMRR